MDLSEKMIETLVMIGYGIGSTVDGFVSLDSPDAVVDMRSVEALRRRGLVAPLQHGVASGLIVTLLSLTDAGWEKFYEVGGEGG